MWKLKNLQQNIMIMIMLWLSQEKRQRDQPLPGAQMGGGGVMVRPLFVPSPPYESLEEATLRHGLLQY